MADPKHETLGETLEGSIRLHRSPSSENVIESSTNQEDDVVETDVVTPLASEQGSSSGGASEPLEESTSESSPTVHTTEAPKPPTTTPGKSTIVPAAPTTALPSTHVSHDHAVHSYFPLHSSHLPSSKRSSRLPTASGQSSGSLHTLAETEGSEEGPLVSTVKRSSSTRTRSSSGYMRKHHSKSLSMSQPVANLVKSQVNSAHPVYPEQSLASLSPPMHSPHPVRPVPLRAKSSHPADMPGINSPVGNKISVPRFIHTTDNSPISSPGLFTPVANRVSNPLDNSHPRSGSPSLHHLQTPKETHAAEIDVDTISGNKLINTYEVIKELGRGEHGKVKLGRDMESGVYVAIKIVPRYSKERRLGRLGAPQDQTKREVAILKKARHPNVVSLLEVIDDPNKNKVYLVLEYVEHGEIQWRKPGVYPISHINNQRFESERKGISLTLEPSDQDKHLVKTAALRHEGLEKNRRNLPHSSSTPHYSLAYEPLGDDGESLYHTLSQAHSIAPSSTASDIPNYPPSRTTSSDDYVSSYPLAGSMYGPYDDSAYRSFDGEHFSGRKQSLAALSHMSSEVDFVGSDHDQVVYVPALTHQEARNTFRDTLLGLEFLHAIGIIHRDIKPSNLLVASDGAVKISDFGVSYFGQPITEEEAETKNKVLEGDAKPLDDERELARSVGTPGFWAPELCYEDTSIFADGKVPKITGAIDMWALGITLYAMTYARLPFYASVEMGLHEAACTTDPVLPKTRLTPVDTSQGEEITDGSQPINSNKRFDYELKFEIVPDSLRDLISKLLIKDPARRITIAEAKSHPWVLEDMQDPAQFLKPPEVLEKGSKKRILEVNEKEMQVAVTKRSFVEKVTQATGRIVNNMLKGMTTGRKRATSTSTNTAASNSSESINTPSGSTTSTVGKAERGRDGRRESLHNLDVVSALQRSRESTKEEHPLAQSVTASPDNQSLATSYFDDTPKPTPSPGESPRIYPQSDVRPKLPDRAISGVSTAESVRTIRASQVNPHPTLEPPKDHNARQGSEASLKAKVEGLWEGTTKTFSRFTSRDRRSPYASRSPSASRRSSEGEHRGVPSLAISNAQASGSIAPPDVLRAVNQRLEQASPVSSSPSSPTTTVETYRPAPTSAPAAFLEAQEINQRRHIQETQQKAEEAALASQVEHTINEEPCPPSPDDLSFKRQRSKSMEHPSHPTLDLDAPSRPSISTTVSSLEDIANSSVAQSGSNHSFNVTSGASSPPEESFLSAEYKEHYARDLRNDSEPEFMRTADTVTEHGRPRALTTGKPLESQTEYYDNDGDDENDSSDDEEGMMMGGPKKIFR